MKFNEHAKLIDRSSADISVSFSDESKESQELYMMSKFLVTPAIHELIDRAAIKLSESELVGEYIISFKLLVYAQEDNK